MKSSTATRKRTLLEEYISRPSTSTTDFENGKESFFSIMSKVPNYPVFDDCETKTPNKKKNISQREKVIACLNSDCEEYSSALKKIFAQSYTFKKRRVTGTQKATCKLPYTTSKETSLPMQLQEYPPWETSTLYNLFKRKIKAYNGFKIRSHRDSYYLVVMNDYDHLTGEFKASIKIVMNTYKSVSPIR